MSARRLSSAQAAFVIGAALVVLLATGLRFHWLDAQSLWNDEGNSLRLAQRDLDDLVDAAGRDIHPPGYYVLLKAWTAAGGESEFSLRAFSVWAGVLAVAVTISLGQRLFGRAAGVLAGLLVACSPFAVYYSQETRMYAQLGLLSAASLWVLVRWLQTGGGWGRWALALALVNAAGLYTQYSFPFSMLAQSVLLALWLAIRRPGMRPVQVFVALNALTLVLFLPWLPTAWDQVTNWPRTGVDLALADQLRTVLTWITYGHTAGRVAVGWLVLPGLLAAAVLLRPDRRDRGLPSGWRIALPVIWAGIVIGALLVSGAYREANLKFLLPAQIALALLIAGGAARLATLAATGSGWLRLVPGVAALVLVPAILAGQADALDHLYRDPAYARSDYRAMAAALTARASDQDAIILDAPNQAEVFTYYYAGPTAIYELPRGLGGDDAQTRVDVLDVIADHRHIYVLFWGEEERDPNRVVQATLDADAYPVASTWYGDVRLAQYAVLGPAPTAPQVETAARFGPSIVLDGYALSADALAPGEVLGVTLFWHTTAPLDVRYKVTVQLLAADGTLAGQHDAEPGGNRVLTTTWTPGETVVDTHGLVIPPELAPGDYTLIVGLYDPDAPLERLPVTVDGAAVGDVFTFPALPVR